MRSVMPSCSTSYFNHSHLRLAKVRRFVNDLVASLNRRPLQRSRRRKVVWRLVARCCAHRWPTRETRCPSSSSCWLASTRADRVPVRVYHRVAMGQGHGVIAKEEEAGHDAQLRRLCGAGKHPPTAQGSVFLSDATGVDLAAFNALLC